MSWLFNPEPSSVYSVPENKRPEGSNPTADLAYGFGMTSMSIKRADARVLSRNNDSIRKRRSDANENVFNSNKKQRAVFTALHYCKKWRCLHAPGEVFDDLELREALELLDKSNQQQFVEGAASFQQQAAYLSAEVENFLRQTNV
jgi:hypothetical protein